jgi:hypothetical protein
VSVDRNVIPEDLQQPTGAPLHAYARRADPETSHQAAASVQHTRWSQQCVLYLLRAQREPVTDERIVELYEEARDRFQVFPQQSPSGIRTRRSELVRQGLVEYTGIRVPLASGRNARTWAAVGSVASVDT